MGVKGLTAFIDENPCLLQDHKLQNCRVVIDGNNLTHFIYNQFKSGYQYDGDLGQFYRKIVQVFLNFKKCRIEPFVIFDGGYDVSDSKLRTVLQRAENRLKQVAKGNNLLPGFGNKLLIKVLDKLDVKHATCPFEADEEIAVLANQWQCYVISNDSDFFVYHIKVGFVPMNYIDFRPVKNKDGSFHMNVQLYHHNHFHEVLDNFDPKLIPLIATVLGNDFVKQDTFICFTDKFDKPKYRIKDTSKLVSKITAIVRHFEKYETFDEGMATITENFVTKGGVASLNHVIQESVNSYMKIGTSKSSLENYFCGKDSQKLAGIEDYFGRELPDWLLRSFACGKASPNFQNIAVLHRLILLAQTEDLKQPSSHKISMHIRQVVFGILLKNTGVESEISGKVGKKLKISRNNRIEEVDRDGQQIRHNLIEPKLGISNYGTLPDLFEIENLTVSVRKQIVLRTLGVSDNVIIKFPESLQLLVAILCYWVHHGKIRDCELKSLIFGIVYLKVINRVHDIECGLIKPEKTSNNINFGGTNSLKTVFGAYLGKNLDIEKTLKSMSPKLLTNMNLEFEANIKTDISWIQGKEFKSTLPRSILHGYAQYQSCLLFSILLNEVLNFPFKEPILWETYDGATVYQFYKYFSLNGENCDKIRKISPELHSLCESICKGVLKEVSSKPAKLTKSQKKQLPKCKLHYSDFWHLTFIVSCIVLFFAIILYYYT